MAHRSRDRAALEFREGTVSIDKQVIEYQAKRHELFEDLLDQVRPLLRTMLDAGRDEEVKELRSLVLRLDNTHLEFNNKMWEIWR